MPPIRYAGCVIIFGALSAHEHHHDGGRSSCAETQPLCDRSPRRYPRPRGAVGAEDDRDWVGRGDTPPTRSGQLIDKY